MNKSEPTPGVKPAPGSFGKPAGSPAQQAMPPSNEKADTKEPVKEKEENV
jgi:hypothetical protein